MITEKKKKKKEENITHTHTHTHLKKKEKSRHVLSVWIVGNYCEGYQRGKEYSGVWPL